MWSKHHFGLMICLVSRHVLWLQELHNKHLLVQWFFSSYFLFWTPKQIEPPDHLQSLYLGWAFSLQLLSVPPNYQARCCPGPLHLTVHLEETVFSQRATFLTAASLLNLWSDVLLSVRMLKTAAPLHPWLPVWLLKFPFFCLKFSLITWISQTDISGMKVHVGTEVGGQIVQCLRDVLRIITFSMNGRRRYWRREMSREIS